MAFSGRGFFRQSQHQEALAFLPCAPGCRGSESDPRYCKCVCRGINHGILVPGHFRYGQERPVPVPEYYNPYIPLLQEPEAYPQLEYREKTVQEKKMDIAKMPEVRLAHATGRIARKIGKKLFAIRPSETELNLEIMNGLRKQFSEEKVNAIVDEAFTEHYSHNPESNTPELYELYESGFIDNTLARRSIRWVIGRPKRK